MGAIDATLGVPPPPRSLVNHPISILLSLV
jgi:hypothetical protein